MTWPSKKKLEKAVEDKKGSNREWGRVSRDPKGKANVSGPSWRGNEGFRKINSVGAKKGIQHYNVEIKVGGVS